MNASLVIDQLSVSEQHELLRALVDRLYPEDKESKEEAFPEWLMESLEAQNQRYRAGLETGDPVDLVDARLRAKLVKS